MEPAFIPQPYAGPPRRHPWEIPLLVVLVVLTTVIYLVAIIAFVFGNPPTILLLFLFAPILLYFGRGITWAQPRVSGVQMSPTQFPDGYAMVAEAAARFGMAKVPDAYVVLGNGQINAFASGHGFRRYVVVYSDLFEIGGQARDADALAFIIGHEVGHIAAGHVSYWRQLGQFAMSYIPVLGTALSRAMEYTADNHGYANRTSGVPGVIGVLSAGKYMLPLVEFHTMANRATTEKGFWPWLANLMATHPVLTWRAAALRDRSRAGAMFFRPKVPWGYTELPGTPTATGPRYLDAS